jgi:cytidine deaminase
LWEFCRDAEVVLANLGGQITTRRVPDLLPDAFDASFIGKKED